MIVHINLCNKHTVKQRSNWACCSLSMNMNQIFLLSAVSLAVLIFLVETGNWGGMDHILPFHTRNLGLSYFPHCSHLIIHQDCSV